MSVVAVVLAATTYLHVWDLATGEQIGDPFTGHRGAQFDYTDSVALGEMNGIPIAVTGGLDGTVQVWSLADPPWPAG